MERAVGRGFVGRAALAQGGGVCGARVERSTARFEHVRDTGGCLYAIEYASRSIGRAGIGCRGTLAHLVYAKSGNVPLMNNNNSSSSYCIYIIMLLIQQYTVIVCLHLML